jgi:hypothetical protein
MSRYLVKSSIVLTISILFTSCSNILTKSNHYKKSFWEVDKTSISYFNCYVQGYEKVNYQSKLILEPPNSSDNNYSKLYLSTKQDKDLKSFNFIRFANDTLYINGGGVDSILTRLKEPDKIFMIFSRENKTQRELNPYTRVGTRIQFKLKKYSKEYRDSLNFYNLSIGASSYGHIIWSIVAGKYSGIVFYTYYDNNINHFCIKDLGSETKNIHMIEKYLKLFEDSVVLRMFNERANYPKGFHDEKGNIISF